VPRAKCLVNAASSTGRCNTIQCIDSTMLAWENHLFGCARPKPSQGSVPVGLTLTSDLGICFQCQVGSCLVLRRPIEITGLTGVDFGRFSHGRSPDDVSANVVEGAGNHFCGSANLSVNKQLLEHVPPPSPSPRSPRSRLRCRARRNTPCQLSYDELLKDRGDGVFTKPGQRGS
jgi:hypothetical protein